MFNISKNKLDTCLAVVKKYEWLLDSYVLDFYVDDHWSKLPFTWQQHLEQLPVERLAELLLQSDTDDNAMAGRTHVLWPLELMALRQVIQSLCISRKPKKQLEFSFPPCALLEHPKLKHVFMKCVKPKKAHEIKRMAAICARSCQETSIDYVVDFGAGLGHLARVLGYGYGINVCCMEMQAELNQQALVIDAKLENVAEKHLQPKEIIHFQRPRHLTKRLSSSTKPAEFLESIREAFQLSDSDSNFQFGIIGLHPCGDLGATLMRLFLNCSEAKFLNFVGCCYQKMSTKETHPHMELHGYPLSTQLQTQVESQAQLSYEAREIACHAVELYHDRLNAGEYEYLKIHSFRAAAERIIVQNFPDLRHCALRNVKHSPGMSFTDYFQRAVADTRFSTLNTNLVSNKLTEKDLLLWHRIVCFYTLRLMLAPLVESNILYDRALFLLEHSCYVNIEAIFDPRISPRNHITRAVKR